MSNNRNTVKLLRTVGTWNAHLTHVLKEYLWHTKLILHSKLG